MTCRIRLGDEVKLRTRMLDPSLSVCLINHPSFFNSVLNLDTISLFWGLQREGLEHHKGKMF